MSIVLYVHKEPDTLAQVSKVFIELGLQAPLNAEDGPWKGLCSAVIPWEADLASRLDKLIHQALPCTPFQLDIIPADGKTAAEFVFHTTHDGKWGSLRNVAREPEGHDWPSSPNNSVFPELERNELWRQ